MASVIVLNVSAPNLYPPASAFLSIIEIKNHFKVSNLIFSKPKVFFGKKSQIRKYLIVFEFEEVNLSFCRKEKTKLLKI